MEQPLQPVFTVSELNEYVGLMLSHDPNMSRVTVSGEISGFHRHPSGHLYFSLKDARAQVRCVMFAGAAQRLSFAPRDGMQVRLTGSAALYARDGSFQLYAQSLKQVGEGELYLRFLALKERMEKAGFFDPAHKKPLPLLPRCVGVVTSSAGAALQDIKNVIARRFPTMPLRLYPAAVQGEGAAMELAAAIRRADKEGRCDVLIVGRGGGSLEDLWAFNEAEPARAIYDCRIPVISAVGHETDFSITDFVADLRAPTPSAAAELAVPEWDKLTERLHSLDKRLENAVAHGLKHKRDRLLILRRSGGLVLAERRLFEARQRLSESGEALLTAPKQAAQVRRQQLAALSLRLEGNSPARTLERGFALVRDTGGRPVTRAINVVANERLLLCFGDGTRRVRALDGTDETI